jgi:hypothetical protein
VKAIASRVCHPDRTYAVALSNAALPAAAWYSACICVSFFARRAKNETQAEGKVPRRSMSDYVTTIIVVQLLINDAS